VYCLRSSACRERLSDVLHLGLGFIRAPERNPVHFTIDVGLRHREIQIACD
jgi:hypothetical protein